MKIFQSLLFLSLISTTLFGQAITDTIPKTYYSETDTIYYKWSIYPKVFSNALKIGTVISPGTNNAKGIVLTAYIGKDSLKIYGDNYPYAKRTTVHIETPKGKATVIFRYNASMSNFPEQYPAENDGKVRYQIPEVYELANIIWTLSPSGKKATNLDKDTEYFKRVEKYFAPYLNHPVFKKLDFSQDAYNTNYFDFRENSFIYTFDGDKIVNGGLYNYVMGNDWEGFTNLFTNLLPLVEDFARQSNFKKFYQQNEGYYAAQVNRMEELMPVKDMWQWLEKEFPKGRFNAYKIVFSPLIGGSHSTQSYWKLIDFDANKMFGENVMFICGTDRYDRQVHLSERQKEGLMSGVVFTEIDHNYVNPVSGKYQKDISGIFNHEIWAPATRTTYTSAMAVFNEYMTHAVFCLWVADTFDAETAKFVIKEREVLNVENRAFYKFAAFNQELLKLHKNNPNLTVSELYPLIIAWSNRQIK